MKSLETISNEISVLEAERDFGDITPEGLEKLAVLNLCYDLLTRTSAAQAINVKQPDEMKEPGFEDEFVNKYGVSSNQLADFAFAMITKQGNINLKALLQDAISGFKQKDIAARAGMRAATISDYLNNRKSMTCNNYEKILNTLKK